MKKVSLFILNIFLCLNFFSQAPEAINYQAIVRDGAGAIIPNQSVGIQLSILQGSAAGTTVFQERFTPTTNAFGLVTMQIGTGTPLTGSFSSIDWGLGPYFIETAVDVTGGTNYVVISTTQFMSVPYALHAKTIDTTFLNNAINTVSSDDQNISGSSLNGTDLTIGIENGNSETVDLSALQDGVDDADNDPTNELQALSLSGDTLYLTNGNNVYLGSLVSQSSMSGQLILDAVKMTNQSCGTNCPLSFDDYNPPSLGTFDDFIYTTDSTNGSGVYLINLSVFNSSTNPYTAVVRVNGVDVSGAGGEDCGSCPFVKGWVSPNGHDGSNKLNLSALLTLDDSDIVRFYLGTKSTGSINATIGSKLTIYKLDYGNSSNSLNSNFVVGQYHSGGIVFYVDSTGQHGLVCTPTDIMNQSNNQTDWNTAVSVCQNLKYNGYNDWYLPSKDQLDLIYTNLGNGGFGYVLFGWFNG